MPIVTARLRASHILTMLFGIHHGQTHLIQLCYFYLLPSAAGAQSIQQFENTLQP